MASALSTTKHNNADRFIPLRQETFADASLKREYLSKESPLGENGPLTSNSAADRAYKKALWQNLSTLQYPSDKPLRMLEHAHLKVKSPSSECKCDVEVLALQKIAKVAKWLPRRPTKILDAPGLLDDFYCNLVDWSPQNGIAIGLQCSLVVKLHSSQQTVRFNHTSEINSVSFMNEGKDICIGSKRGSVGLLDVCTMKRKWKVRCDNSPIYFTGSYKSDECVVCGINTLQFLDFRSKRPTKYTYPGQICRAAFDGRFLMAIGSNDNYFALLNNRMVSKPVFIKKNAHAAAVKALTFYGNRLVSGGGLADKTLKIWDISKDCKEMSQLNVGAAVSNAFYSTARNILCVTKGYPTGESIFFYLKKYADTDLNKAPASVVKVEREGRINCAALSPDGTQFMAAGSDETLDVYTLPELPSRSKSHIDKFKSGTLIR